MKLDADSVQGVLFLSRGQSQDDAHALWSSLFPSQSPDAFQRSAKSPNLSSSASGEVANFLVTINVQIARIDIVLAATEPANREDGPPRVADVEQASLKLTALMKRVCERNRIVRTAVILDLARTIVRSEEAAAIKEALPGFPFPDNATDFVLQFNSRSKVGVGDIEMNRLCQWTVGNVGYLRGGMLPRPQNMVAMVPYFGLKIDVNTIPEISISQDDVPLIIDYLAKEALAIRDAGVARLQA